ncbi:lipoprotein NlpI [Vibrio sp. TH_r3]|uniref:lipoprotein NlpI n=1 Tax=Vibrio sp. TH_r3 TaxID=3082084 RepID=UPI0029531668|nr:lipoprotein NlpI [Vibrio sp. TH_r3]MDV7106112.1 lipoprotein NlpI [Vibrio sp. TH_r3]
MKWLQIASVSLMLVLSGCATTTNEQQQWVYPPMAVPLQASIQQEVQIARLNQLLQRSDLNNATKSKMYYERGSYYDSVGLRDLARLDFNQSLNLNPAQPDIFNLLGVYFTQIGEYDAAYEAFDSTLELDPYNEYAERNMAIALYYGGRDELAYQEMKAHYDSNPDDPFRVLWLYIIERELTPLEAEQNLKMRYANKNQNWGWILVAIMLDEVSEEQAFKAVLKGTQDNITLAQRLTEVYFYLAKRYQFSEQYADAIALYKLALSFNVYEYVEHRYSFLELSRIYDDVRAIQQSALEETSEGS